MTKLIRRRAYALLALLAVTGCRAGGTHGNDTAPKVAAMAPILATPDALDTHSFARPLEARVTHISLDLTVDFETKRLAGTATLDVQRRADARQLFLDDKGLEISAITDQSKRR